MDTNKTIGKIRILYILILILLDMKWREKILN
jgi:hypothetical protein